MNADRRNENGMATAEYAMGTLGAVVIAGILLKLSWTDNSIIERLITDILSRVYDIFGGVLKVWHRIR